MELDRLRQDMTAAFGYLDDLCQSKHTPREDIVAASNDYYKKCELYDNYKIKLHETSIN